MNFEHWHIWLIVTVLFLIAEIFLPTFLFASLAIGALLASLAAALQLSLGWQLIFLSTGSIVSFFLIKPLMRYLSKGKKAEVRTNVDGITGRIGKVIETIDENENTGHVAIDGDVWKAVSQNGERIEEGTRVKVCGLDSIVLEVCRLNNGATQPAAKNETIKNILVKIGTRTELIELDEVACMFSENKATYITRNDGKSFIIDDSLEKLQEKLPDDCFFRANRQFILHFNAIRETQNADNGKIEVKLKDETGISDVIIVSRLKASSFRKWVKNNC